VAKLQLDSPLQYVKGVGPKKAEALAKFNLVTVRDILMYLPRHYLDRTTVVPINKAQVDETVTVVGRVRAHGLLHGRRRRYEMILEDETGHISLLWFGGIRFWERVFKKDQVWAATGTVSYFMGHQMLHPDLERLDDDGDAMIHAGRIVPVYPQTAELTKVGLNSKGIRRVTSFVFENLGEEIQDPLPSGDLAGTNLLGLHEAIHKAHYPDHRDQVEQCRRRLAFDELLAFQFLVFGNRSRRAVASKPQKYAPPGELMTRLKDSLPFKLTTGQSRVIKELIADMQLETPMSRLMHGDVGCGKTVVAILAALYAAENNLQVAFMAPTEILAEQHFRNWNEILSSLGVESGLLTGTIKAAPRKTLLAACAEGELKVLFGTHALIYDSVKFDNLGLVIIDEQHRFGVDQRSRLHAKGDEPDLLVMTATPIPRTLTLTLYGDLDVSTVDTMPPGRKPVRTVWRGSDVKEKVFQFVTDEVARGGQVYIVYPVIETNEDSNLTSVEEAAEELTEGALKKVRVGVVHGRVKPKQRDKILEQFREGELDVLLATTVIEVGLDNPNATLMIVEHAERFGLAQLHQLRGRIGRGEKQSTMVALAHHPLSDIARQRLDMFASTTDGFKIAEADLELRGPGEIFGTRQSGLPELKIARLVSDQDLIEKARQVLERLFSSRDQLDSADRRLYNYLKTSTQPRRIDLGGG